MLLKRSAGCYRSSSKAARPYAVREEKGKKKNTTDSRRNQIEPCPAPRAPSQCHGHPGCNIYKVKRLRLPTA